MSGTFGDMDTALAMRDTIERIATSVVERMRPAPIVGEVLEIDTLANKALVRISGGRPNDEPMRVGFREYLRPNTVRNEELGVTGNIVEITGSPGSHWISRIFSGQWSSKSDATVEEIAGQVDQIVSEIGTDGLPPGDAPVITVAPFGVGAIQGSWEPVSNADPITGYEVAASTSSPVATDGSDSLPGFSPNRIVLSEIKNVEIPVGSTVYIRVRAWDRDGPSPWSLEGSASPRIVDFEIIAQAVKDAIIAADDKAIAAQQLANSSVKTYVSEYSVNGSETVAPTTGWSTATPSRTPGTFIWERAVVTRNDNTTSTTSPVLVTGNAGAPGGTGTSVTSVTTYYQLTNTGTAAPAKPIASPAPSPWTTTEPAYVEGKDLWRTDRIVFSAGSPGFSYTDVSKSSAYAAAAAAMVKATSAFNSANGKNTRRSGPVITTGVPSTPAGSVVGDTYWGRTAGVVKEQWVYDGTTWAKETVDVTVIANLDADFIKARMIQVNSIFGDLAAFGEINADMMAADYAYLGSVEAAQIKSGTLSAVISISTDGVINVGKRITIADPALADGSGGIVIWADDAHTEPLVSLHPDGSIFKGKVDANEITVIEALRLIGTGSTVAANSSISLAFGVANPSAPSITQATLVASLSWPAVPSGYYERGLCWDATASRWWQLFFRTSDNGVYVRTVTQAGVAGSLRKLTQVSNADLGNVSGCWTLAVTGTTLVAMVQHWPSYDPGGPSRMWVVGKWSTAGTGTLSLLGSQLMRSPIFPWNDNFSSSDTYAVTADATYVYIAYGEGGGGYYFARLVLSTLSSATFVQRYADTSPSGGATYPRGLILSDPAVGTNTLGVQGSNGVVNYFQTDAAFSTMTHISTKNVTLESSTGSIALRTGTAPLGMHHDKRDLKLTRYSDYYTAVTGEKVWAQYTDQAGTDTTLPSPQSAGFTMLPRRFATVILNPAPAGITSSAVWVGWSAASPGVAKKKRTEALTGRTMLLSLGRVTGTDAMPTVSTTSGSPASLFSQVGGFLVNGDGSGGWPYIMPPGSLLAYAGTTLPLGWVWASGAAISRTAYADLFAAIGTLYGAGDGTTTFNVPNLNGRTLVARDSTQTEFDTVGETGGSKTHTQTVAQMPTHGHTLQRGGDSGSALSGTTNNFWISNLAGSDNSAIADTGGGSPFPILSPYMVVNYMIKI